MNDVALRANDVLRNDVMLRINDVALRANGMGTAWQKFLSKMKKGLAWVGKKCYNK